MKKVSIIIPAYKSMFLKYAIESIVKQTYQNWELIIIDDCSPEDIYAITLPFLNDKRIQYYRNECNYGAEHLSQNWNNALNYCTGDYVICMGDDDMMTPNALHEYMCVAEKRPDVDVIHGQTEVIDEENKIIELMEPRWEWENVLELIYYRMIGSGRQQFIGDFCYKLSEIRKHNGFYNLPLAWGSDDITAVIAASENGIANTREVCFYYRKNSFSISSDNNGPRKLEAMHMHELWYQKFLSSYKPKDKKEAAILRLLKELLPISFTLRTNNLLRIDMSGGLLRLFFWINKRKKYKITVRQILIAFIKSLKKT